MYIIESPHFSRKIYSYYALFELEDTLIVGYTLKNLATKPIWFNFNKICKIFRDLKQAGYVIAILTDISNKNKTQIQRALNAQKELEEALGWTPFFIINTNPKNNKPSTYSFDLLKTLMEKNQVKFMYKKAPEGLPAIFYCGNKAGKSDPYPPYQFSGIDKYFAHQIKAKYIRPLDMIGSQEIIRNFKIPRYSPSKKIPGATELIITMGMPGSGKSYGAYSFASKNSYKVCDKDDIDEKDEKIKQKKEIECVKKGLKQGQSTIAVALNNTNAKRKEFIDIAKELGVPYRIVWFIRDGRPFNKLRGSKENEEFMKDMKNKIQGVLHSEPVPNKVYEWYMNEFELPKETYSLAF